MSGAIGIDVGGTKIDARVFDASWAEVDRQRVETPQGYDALVAIMAELVAWGEDVAGAAVPVGVSSAGIVDPETGLMLTANLGASGKPLPEDVAEAVGRPVAWLNDARALALSEAMLGAGRGHRVVQALVIGTGLGGGLVIDGRVRVGPSGAGGEIGHTALPARFDLEPVHCGCGRRGCLETYLSGPGLVRLSGATTPEVAVAARTGAAAEAWGTWCGLLAECVRTLTLTVDPDVIVLGGGMSTVDGLLDDLAAALGRVALGQVRFPPVVLAEGGAESGARGAALAAVGAAR